MHIFFSLFLIFSLFFFFSTPTPTPPMPKLRIRETNGKSNYFLYPCLNRHLLRTPVPHCALLRFFVNTKSMPDLFWLQGSLGFRAKAEFIDCYRCRFFCLTRGNRRCAGAAAPAVRRDPAALHPPLLSLCPLQDGRDNSESLERFRLTLKAAVC